MLIPINEIEEFPLLQLPPGLKDVKKKQVRYMGDCARKSVNGVSKKKQMSAMSDARQNYTAPGEIISITIDSGAAESVMPMGIHNDYPMNRNELTGTQYDSADGGTITTVGEKVLVLDLPDGCTRGLRMQVADTVTKPLGAVSRITSRGNRVVFDEEEGYIENKKTGEKTWFVKRDDVYVLDAVVRPYSAGFQRQS